MMEARLTVAIASLAKVASSLMNILRSPESSIGNVYIDCKSSSGATN